MIRWWILSTCTSATTSRSESRRPSKCQPSRPCPRTLKSTLRERIYCSRKINSSLSFSITFTMTQSSGLSLNATCLKDSTQKMQSGAKPQKVKLATHLPSLLSLEVSVCVWARPLLKLLSDSLCHWSSTTSTSSLWTERSKLHQRLTMVLVVSKSITYRWKSPPKIRYEQHPN